MIFFFVSLIKSKEEKEEKEYENERREPYIAIESRMITSIKCT